jgi:hypothetical protein
MALQSAFKLDYRAAAATIAGADAPFFTAPVGRGSFSATAPRGRSCAKGESYLKSLFARRHAPLYSTTGGRAVL